jgi:hypothetical protein
MGASGDVPAPGDYDGDDKADLTVFRPNTTVWWVLKSANASVAGQQWETCPCLLLSSLDIAQQVNNKKRRETLKVSLRFFSFTSSKLKT